MLMKLDTSWLIFAIVAVTMISYIVSSGLDSILKDDGFGPFGMTFIITIAFFATIYLSNEQGVRFGSLIEAALAGLAGSLCALLVLVVAKVVLRRFM